MQKIFSIVLVFFLVACSSKKVVYKDVYIPTKCDIEMPKKPTFNGDILHDIKEALKHSEMLEKSLNFCIKGE